MPDTHARGGAPQAAPSDPLQRSRYLVFDRPSWAALRASTPLHLTSEELGTLRGLNEPVTPADVTEVFLPLSRLLNLHVAAARSLHSLVQGGFLASPIIPPPFVIGVAGSVGVGKSTFARVLRAMLARWPDHPRVELVTTDGFLHPTDVLRARGLLHRKGFPESYDLKLMLNFLAAVKAGEKQLRVPMYSHQSYDIVPGQHQTVNRPDVLIFEGLNVLQTMSTAPVVASDFFDFSVYLDAEQEDIEAWYVERFLLLQRTAFHDPRSYFHHYRDLTEAQAREIGSGIWHNINLPNLRENILPTRERARLVLRKGPTHAVREVWLRRM